MRPARPPSMSRRNSRRPSFRFMVIFLSSETRPRLRRGKTHVIPAYCSRPLLRCESGTRSGDTHCSMRQKKAECRKQMHHSSLRSYFCRPMSHPVRSVHLDPQWPGRKIIRNPLIESHLKQAFARLRNFLRPSENANRRRSHTIHSPTSGLNRALASGFVSCAFATFHAHSPGSTKNAFKLHPHGVSGDYAAFQLSQEQRAIQEGSRVQPGTSKSSWSTDAKTALGYS